MPNLENLTSQPGLRPMTEADRQYLKRLKARVEKRKTGQYGDPSKVVRADKPILAKRISHEDVARALGATPIGPARKGPFR